MNINSQKKSFVLCCKMTEC